MDLTPSQTIKGTPNGNGQGKSRNRNRNGKQQNNQKGEGVGSNQKEGTKGTEVPKSDTTDPSANQKPAARRNRQRRRPKKNNSSTPAETNGDPGGPNVVENGEKQLNENKNGKGNTKKNNKKNKKGGQQQQQQQQQLQQQNQEKNENNGTVAPQERNQQTKAKKRNRNRKNKWWKKHVPDDAVDPITLDPLKALHYPPFALVSEEPYEPVEEWPIAKSTEKESLQAVDNAETEEERQRRILQEQWGKKVEDVVGKIEDSEETSEKKAAANSPSAPSQRHVNLFDGRALAYYMVSQLQFIDPLNRRDLTRDELVNLDRYLRRHGFGDTLNVTEAYDTKGITISSAGAAANTAAGRAAIIQQEAGNLLRALFGGASVSAAQGPRQNNALMRQYQAHEAATQQQQRQRIGRAGTSDDVGIYGDDNGGLVVIDDDLNPALRGNAPAFYPPGDERNNSERGTLWSASHIASRYGHDVQVREHEFPSLAAAAPAPAATDPDQTQEKQKAKKPLPVAKSLMKIGSAIKKTDPEELQRQWEAREEARKKAMLSNLTFGSNPAAWGGPSLSPAEQQMGIPTQITTMSVSGPTEGQIERNKAFADALGIKPATSRALLKSGWARPTDTKAELDDFGNELNHTIYPDSLIMKARQNSAVLLKLERRWKMFLEDDTAASLPLSKMVKPLRAFVHEYATFWKMHTESFDPEPKRYVHCVKLRDTSAPYPLLSDAARNWRGPKPIITSLTAPVEKRSEHPSLQTAGQSTQGRELPAPPTRKPLDLKPRSLPDSELTVDQTDKGTAAPSGFSIGGAPSRLMTESLEPSQSRFGALTADRARPKLDLKPRTLPLELPPHQNPSEGFDVAEELERQRQRTEARLRREKELAERKQRALEEAFASDDEKSVRSAASDDSEWEEQEALYDESD